VEYFLIYLLMKLNDIRGMMLNDYGYTVGIFFALLFYAAVRTWKSEEDTSAGEGWPFKAIHEKQHRSFRKFALFMFTFTFFIQLSLNIIAGFLPSTGQAVAIISGGAGLKSDTFKALKDMDPAIANYLRGELHKYLPAEEVKTAAVVKEKAEKTIKEAK